MYICSPLRSLSFIGDIWIVFVVFVCQIGVPERTHCIFCRVCICKLSPSHFGLFSSTTWAVSPQWTHCRFRSTVLYIYIFLYQYIMEMYPEKQQGSIGVVKLYHQFLCRESSLFQSWVMQVLKLIFPSTLSDY